MLGKDLPKEILLLAENERNRIEGEYKDLSNEDVHGFFCWDLTPQGSSFWNEIYKGNFNPYYDKYGSYELVSSPSQYLSSDSQDFKIGDKVKLNKSLEKAIELDYWVREAKIKEGILYKVYESGSTIRIECEERHLYLNESNFTKDLSSYPLTLEDCYTPSEEWIDLPTITKDNIQSFDGLEFICDYYRNNEKQKVLLTGKLSYYCNELFMCQNEHDGVVCKDKKGFKYSYKIRDIINTNYGDRATNIKIKNKNYTLNTFNKNGNIKEGSICQVHRPLAKVTRGQEIRGHSVCLRVSKIATATRHLVHREGISAG